MVLSYDSHNFHVGVTLVSKCERLYNDYYGDVFNFVQSRLRHTQEGIVSDIVQETFARVCEHEELIEQFDREKTKAWLLKVAHHICVDYWRKSRKFEEDLIPDFDALSKEFMYDGEIEEQLHSQLLKDLILELLSSLKIEHQQAIYLYDLQHSSYKECARKMDMTEAAFTSLLKRARKAFKTKVLEAYDSRLMKMELSDYERRTIRKWFDILNVTHSLDELVSLKSSEFFNGFIEKYDSFRNETYPHGLNNFLISLASVHKNSIVADFGCGTGSLTMKLAPLVQKVYAVDHSKEMIHTIQSLKKRHKNIEPALLDVTKGLSDLGGKVDIGFSCMLLHHIFDPETAIAEMANALEPGGQLVIADLIHTIEDWRNKESHDFWSGFKIEQLKGWLENANLKVLQIGEQQQYAFRFTDKKDENKKIEVPLLFAHSVKMG